MHNQQILLRTALVAALLVVSVPAAAQLATNSRQASRADLQTTLHLLDGSASSSAYSEPIRARARADANIVRSRLAAGDFRAGDQIHLRVVGPTQLVDDTLSVTDSLTLIVPGIRSVSLKGVLRSELGQTLTRDLGEVVKEVAVTARPLLRIAVLGQVAEPGYKTVSSETLLDQLITLSGGPTATAGIDKMEFTRGDTVLMKGEVMTRAIADGTTLAALNLRDGDVLTVPIASQGTTRATVIQFAGYFIGPLVGLLVFR